MSITGSAYLSATLLKYEEASISLVVYSSTSAMEDSNRGHSNSSTLQRSFPDGTVTAPVRTRWTPNAEQMLILESIFNSGMVNPSKDETARIRRLLEQFGPVGDVNVFSTGSRTGGRGPVAASASCKPNGLPMGPTQS
ncbi:hypothetical protein BHM03_00034983 [Ensete ventricosum]|nr:hypothetical protein BHM03_00034983 [Ensete ventricosum]